MGKTFCLFSPHSPYFFHPNFVLFSYALRIYCEICEPGLDICLDCFANSVVVGQHKPFHRYRLVDFRKLSERILKKRNTVCSRSLDSFCIVTYYMKWGKTSWDIQFMFYVQNLPLKFGKIPLFLEYLIFIPSFYCELPHTFLN